MYQYLIFVLSSLGLTLGIASPVFAQWVDTNGPTDASTTCIAAVGDDVFLGTHGEGIFYSSDKGIKWHQVKSEWFVKALAYSGSTVYAGLENEGLWYSTDNGQFWNQVDFSGLNYYYNGANALATSGKTVFAATQGGLICSTDLGKSWTEIDTGLYGVGSHCVASALAIRGTNLYVGGWTSDTTTMPLVIDGTEWNIINLGIPRMINGIAISDSTIFAAAALGSVSSPSKLFRSTNNRASWDSVYSMESYIGAVTGVTINAGTVFLSTDRDSIFRSTDNGTTWTPVCTGLTCRPITTISSEGGVIYAGTELGAGIFRSVDNGDHWISTGGNGLSRSKVVKFTSTTTHLFALTTGLYSTTNDGDNWYPLPIESLTDTCLSITAVASVGSSLFVANGYHDGKGLFLSTDEGLTWRVLHSPGKDTGVGGLAVLGSSLFANLANGSTYLSTDTGKTWIRQTFALNLNSFASRGSEVFATDFGVAISHTYDQGVTWNGFSYLSIFPFTINCIAATDTSVFAGTDIGLYRMGNHSFDLYYPGEREVIHTLLAIGNTLIAGTDGGIYLTTNDGADWTRIDEYYSQFGSSDLLYAYDGYLFGYFNACTVGRRRLSDFGLSGVHRAAPVTDRLGCSPNPASSLATISFTNTQRETVNVSVINVLGKECVRLFSGELDPGEHPFQLDVSHFPTGMYVCLVRSNGLTKQLPVSVVR